MFEGERPEEASFERFRQDFAYIIVETVLYLPRVGMGLSFAACSDGVVVAFESWTRSGGGGPRPHRAFEDGSNVPILGVVTEATKSITAF